MNLESDECGEPQTTILYAQSGPQRRGPAHRQIRAHLRRCSCLPAPASCLLPRSRRMSRSVPGRCCAFAHPKSTPIRVRQAPAHLLGSSHFLCKSDRLLLAASRPPRGFSRAAASPPPPLPRSAAARRRPRPDLRLACRYPRQPASCFALSVQIQRCAPRRSLEARWPLAPPCSF